MRKILLIGCGHMGNALLDSWIKSKNYTFTLVDPIQYKYLKQKYSHKNIQIIKNIDSIKKNVNFDFVVFAVRPVDLDNVLNQLSKIEFKKNTSFISVIAGKKLATFKRNFKYQRNFFTLMSPNIIFKQC